MPTLRANGIQIQYELSGSGSPIVFISGLSYGLWTWRWLAPLLEAENRVLTFDNRGVDGTEKPPGPYSTALLAQDVLALLDLLDLPPCTLVGHSLGGFIAQEAALAKPNRARKLVLMSTSFAGPNSLPPTPAALATMMDRSGGLRAVAERALGINAAPGFAERHPDRTAEYFRYREAFGMTPESYQAQLMAGITHNSEARVGQLKMPVLIIQGAHDPVVQPRNAELLAARIPQASLHVLPDAGHMLPLEKPEHLAELIAGFAAPD